MPQAKKPSNYELYLIAEAQAGYVTFTQARDAGFTKQLLSHHARTGRLVHVEPGIYRLVPFPDMPHADLFVAWLRTGPYSVISHESALALYGLSDIIPSEIHITVPRTASRRRKSIRLHTNRLGPEEVTRRDGLPVTTVTRTIADVIRSGLPREQAEQAIREALDRGLVTRQALQTYSRQRGGRAAQMIEQVLRSESSR